MKLSEQTTAKPHNEIIIENLRTPLILGSAKIFFANSAEITGDKPKTKEIMPDDR